MRFMLIALVFQLFSSQVVLANDAMLLRLHGSNTIGAELGPQLVKYWLHDEGYTNIQLSKLKDQEIEISAIDANGQKKKVEIYSHGSSTAFTALRSGNADIGMSSRPIKSKEKSQMKDYGDMARDSAEFVVGLDGIAVIVNKSNPLLSLGKESMGA